MIVTEIYKGQGLGNQLACYITTRVIAKDSGYDFGIQCPERLKCLDFLDLDLGKQVIGGTGPEGGPPHTRPVGIKNYYKERKITHPLYNVDISTYDKNLVSVPDDTKIDGNMQGEQYIAHRKAEIKEWLKIKKEIDCFDYASDNICVINFRGGEYVDIKKVFLPKSYWEYAINTMRNINRNFKFVVVTDDVYNAKRFFPDFDVFHFSIGKDFSIIKNAHYLILSNSSFAWFPAWVNENLKFCIAPKYWWGYNVSDGFWACDYNITSGWWYLDRNGTLSDYASCLKELSEYKKTHKEYYPEIRTIPTKNKKILNNFLIVSNYNNDIQWVPEYTNNYIIYNKGKAIPEESAIDPTKVIQSPNVGYNLYDYFTFIIDNYETLPDCVIFTKGNIFPRHVRKEYFDMVVNNNFFTPLEDKTMHEVKMPACFFDENDGFNEINNSWYAQEYKTKYFHNYNDFLRFCFVDPIIPKYTRFAPGGNYIVPRQTILKLPKVFYENLRAFISHCQLPGEAHILERALYTLWNSNFTIHQRMLSPIKIDVRIKTPYTKENVFLFIKKHTPIAFKIWVRKIINFLKENLKRVRSWRSIKKTIHDARTYVKEFIKHRKKLSTQEIEEYKGKIKVYDVFTFFNELELLEIRLNVLDKYVDYFVIVEATETFSGFPKRLFYEEHKDRFKQFAHKIIHYVVRDTPADEDDLRKRLYDNNINDMDKEIVINALTSDNVPKGQIHWLKEFYQKENIKKALLGLKDNDICFVSDVDEIWNPETTIDYSRDDIFKLKQTAYFYYLNNRSNDYWVTGWTGTIVTKYKNIKNNCLNHLRTASKNKYTVIRKGGWHFTFQGGAERIKKKLESYGHQEFNSNEIKSNIENVLLKNRDYRGRRLKFWVDESDLPKYVLENKERYKHLFKPR